MCLQNQVTDLAELQHAHMQYLAQTHHHCLMSQSTREVRAIIEPVLQCIVDFTNSCRYVCCTMYAARQLYEHAMKCICCYLSSNRRCHCDAHNKCSRCEVMSFLVYVWPCRSSDNTVNDMQQLIQDEGCWSPVHRSIQEFQLRTSVLYKVLKYANGRGHYQELFVQLDFNKYYADV